MEKYIMVDMDADCIRVYPANEESDEAVAREFFRDDFSNRFAWKAAAELHAKKEAERIGADWGCNY